MNKPDILIFNPDSYRGDVLGHLGNRGAVTPCFDALVRVGGGVSYANAFAQNPVCTPSRCSFMTGWYPHVHGYRSMRNMLKSHDPSLFGVLRRNGYHVWWGGKNDLFAVEKPEDFLHFCDTKFRPASSRYTGYRSPPPLAPDDPRQGAFYGGVMPRDATAEYDDADRAHVDGAIARLRQASDGRPLCMYLPLQFPHPAYHTLAKFYKRIDPERLPPRIPAPDPAAGHPPVLNALRREFGAEQITDTMWLDVKRIYYAMCSQIDHLFGQLVAALKETGRYENTLIVVLSDHGDFAGDYSLPEKTHQTLQDCLLRVPFIVKPPAGVPVRPGLRQALTELIDMPATIYDLLQLDPEYTVQGRSLRASLAGDDAETRDAVFAEVGKRPHEARGPAPEVSAMPPESFYPRQSRAARPFNTIGSYAVSCRTRDFKYVRRAYTADHELYDLRRDPGECHNLHGAPEVASVEAQLERRLLEYFMQTGDVLPRKQDSRQIH